MGDFIGSQARPFSISKKNAKVVQPEFSNAHYLGRKYTNLNKELKQKLCPLLDLVQILHALLSNTSLISITFFATNIFYTRHP